MRFRVASSPASSGLARFASPGCPVPARFGRVGDESSGCPEFSVHWPCRRWISELPRISHPSAVQTGSSRVAPTRCSTCAAFQCISRVAPRCASSGFAGDGSPGCPEFRIFRRCRWRSRRVSPASPTSGIADDQAPSCPESCVSRHRLVCLQVALDCTFRFCQRRVTGSPRMLFSSGHACGRTSGLPRLFNPPALPIDPSSRFPRIPNLSATRLRFLRLPRFCISGWVDDESLLSSNFASSAEPRMNLREQSGFAALA